MEEAMKILTTLILMTLPFVLPTQDRTDKRCVVTEVLVGGTKSDCGGWEAAKGEKVIMLAEVNKRLKVGDVFYFVWKCDRWVAEIREKQ